MSLPANANTPIVQSEVPWGGGTGIGAVVIAVFVQLLGIEGVNLVLPAHLRHVSIWLSIALYQFLALGVVLAVVVLIFARYQVGPSALGFRRRGWKVLATSAGSVVLIFMGVALVSWIFTTFLPGYGLSGNSQELTQGTGSNLPLWQVFLIALFTSVEAPLVEETLFRGILFQGLRGSFSAWMPHARAALLAALCSGLVFGFLHGEIHTLPILVFLGAALAYVFYLSDTLYGSMIVHGIFNLLAVVFTFHVHL